MKSLLAIGLCLLPVLALAAPDAKPDKGGPTAVLTADVPDMHGGFLPDCSMMPAGKATPDGSNCPRLTFRAAIVNSLVGNYPDDKDHFVPGQKAARWKFAMELLGQDKHQFSSAEAQVVERVVELGYGAAVAGPVTSLIAPNDIPDLK